MADRDGFLPPFFPPWMNTGFRPRAPPFDPFESRSSTNPNPNPSVDPFGIRGIVRDELAMDLGFGLNPTGLYSECNEAPETGWLGYHDAFLSRDMYHCGNNSMPSTCVENGIILPKISKVSEDVKTHNPFKTSPCLEKDTTSYKIKTSSRAGVDPIHMNEFGSKSFLKFPQKNASAPYDVFETLSEEIVYPHVEGNSSFVPQLDSCSSNLIPCHLAMANNGKFINGYDASSRVSGDRFGASMNSFPRLDLLQNSSVSLDQTVDSPCWKGASSSHQSPFDFVETLTQNKLLPAIVEQYSNTLRDEAKHDGEKEMGQEEKYSQASVVGTSGGVSETCASSTLMGKNASLNFIVGELQNLSNMLLSSEIDASQMNSHNHELLKLVIDNLEAFVFKNKKDSQIFGMKSDYVMNHSNVERYVDCEIGNELHSIETNVSNGELDDFGLNDTDSTAEAFQKILQKKIGNAEENLQSQVYKKLWIDAEAALCSMKYKLQLSQMKIKAENRNHKTKGKVQRVSSLSSMDSLDDHKKPETSSKMEHLSRDASTASIHERDGSLLEDTDFDALVMARLNVLKGQGDGENLASTTEQQPKFVLGFCPVKRGFIPSNELENVMGSTDIDAQVMDRLKVLRGRGDESFMSTEKQHEKSVREEAPANVMSGVDIDAQVMAKLKVLRGRGDGKSFMSTEEAPVDVMGSADIDESVMGRLGVLRGRGDAESLMSTERKPEESIPEEAPANVMASLEKSLQGEAPPNLMGNADIDALVTATLGVLRGQGDAECSTSTEKQSEKSLPEEAPTNVIDNTDFDAQVMARLGILKGRDDQSFMSTEQTSDVNDWELSAEWEHVLFEDLI